MDDFIKVAKIIYKGCEQYVPDLDSDVRNLFKPKKNPGMKFSIIQPFVAYKDRSSRWPYRWNNKQQSQRHFGKEECTLLYD